MKGKTVRVAIIDLAFTLAIIALALSFFSLGFVVGRTAESMIQEEEIIAEEYIEPDFYFEDVPLTYEEQECLFEASEEFGVDYCVMLGLIEKETDFRNISGDGGKASGYCQVWEYWWSDLMTDIGAEDLNNPKDNFRTACAIVAELRDQYGSMAGALTAYNKGSYDGTVSRYAASVLENAEKWRMA